MKQARVIFMCFIFMALMWPPVSGQFFDENSTIKYDTSYIEVYKDELTTRLYLSRKQNGYTLADRLYKPWIQYKTNDNLVLGLGYTYSFLTINLGLKMPFINGDDELYGKSKYLDLQTHFMFRSYIVDFYLQWNNGYYISNPEDLFYQWDSEQNFPQRGDMRTNILGLNVQYLFNSSRYSYKAAFWQNEFQKRSAGSPIVGLEAYWMLGMTDSLMVAGGIPPTGFMENDPFNQSDILNVGINGGYAYTFVWAEKLYLSLTSLFGLSGGYNRVHYTPDSHTLNSGFTVGVTNTTRISLGYNNSQYYLGLSLQRFSMATMAGSYGDWFSYNTGNIRISFVKRFKLKRSIKILRPDLWIL
jgi:Domain of unknown function (DUF4421)